MVLLAFLHERTFAVGISSRAAFYLFAVALADIIFPQFCEERISFACVDKLQSKQIFHYICVCKVISA